MRWPERSMAVWIDECPSRLWTVSGCSPAAIGREA
jgi:hypothetical protein